MLYSALSGNEYKCFLDKDRILPMMHIDDSVQASIKLMNIDRKISINSPYNITSFNISPDLWRNIINSLGYNLKVLFEKDFRDKIAQSWPRNIDDHLFRNDVGWSQNTILKIPQNQLLMLLILNSKSVDKSVIGDHNLLSLQNTECFVDFENKVYSFLHFL